VLAAFRDGLALYRQRDWPAAERCFRAATTANPADQPSRIYLERCRVYAATPPPLDWDGVSSMKDKQ
jgi:adenylate cyclase